MSDIIQLLPDHVANQIAAGEVVQRPASVVKEMLENSIDAGATLVELLIKDAGRTLVQVIDNGAGMSATDARMSFERHATSKLRKAEDLFALSTMGFRGEALASIAAVAHIELKTKLHDAELGTQIIIEGSDIKDQSPCACEPGTSLAVKNLFFNIPARRNFLKSDNVELNHIMDEFNRIALIHPEVAFHVYNNGKQTISLPSTNLKLRIISLMGNSFQSKLVPIEQNTQNIHISGFIATPDAARRTRGDQFFFVNKRFIKHPYLHHAIDKAYSELIPQGYFPGYFISIDVDPQTIDVNIHPTKTEIKFTDDKLMYGFLTACVKRTLGINSLTPTLDFNTEQYFNVDNMPKDYIPKEPTLNLNPSYNPFSNPNPPSNRKAVGSSYTPQTAFNSEREENNAQNWNKLYEFPEQNIDQISTVTSIQSSLDLAPIEDETHDSAIFQFNRKYIVSKIKSGILLIDQQAAHERILFEKYLQRIQNSRAVIQQTLFPQSINYSASEAELIREISKELFQLGFDIQEFGQNSFIVNGTPSDIEDGDVKQIIDGILENFKNNLISHRLDKEVNIALSMAKCASIKHGTLLSQIEMHNIIDELFACEVHEVSPSGRKTTVTIIDNQLNNLFN
jgi:DNA mismatch repair protein MutL